MAVRAQIQRLSLGENRTVTVTLKPHVLNVFEEPVTDLWTFDIEGRLVGMYVDQVNYRRTLDNRFFMKSRTRIAEETHRSVNPVPADRAEELLNRGRFLLHHVEPRLPAHLYLAPRPVPGARTADHRGMQLQPVSLLQFLQGPAIPYQNPG